MKTPEYVRYHTEYLQEVCEIYDMEFDDVYDWYELVSEYLDVFLTKCHLLDEIEVVKKDIKLLTNQKKENKL